MKAKGENDRMVQAIGWFRLVKAALLIVAATGALSILHKDQAVVISRLIQRFSVDPNARYFQIFVQKFMEISPKLPLITLGMFLYAALFGVEGIGLLMRKRWAEYVTVISTSGFLPLEIYEMTRHATVIKGIVIAVNVAIVVYLVWKVRRHPKAKSGDESTESSAGWWQSFKSKRHA